MKIEILLFDGFDDLDAFGPFEVLAGADHFFGAGTRSLAALAADWLGGERHA